MAKPISQMSAEEYKEWMFTHPEEAKELDKPTSTPITPTVVWRNGVAVQIVDNHQTSQNGIVQ